jgi:hypothetical protein
MSELMEEHGMLFRLAAGANIAETETKLFSCIMQRNTPTFTHLSAL